MSEEPKRERYALRSRSRSSFRKSFYERSYGEDDYKSRRQDYRPDMRRAGGSGMNRVNISIECRVEIKDLFREKVGNASVELFEDETGKFYCGSHSPLRRELNDHKNGRQDYSSDLRRSGGSAKNTVFVTNIPFESRMEIKDLFQEKVGDVAFVELLEDETGKFNGCGVVEFKNSESAEKAIEIMYKHEIRGQQLIVKKDTGDMGRSRTSSRGGDQDLMNKDLRSDPPFNTYGLNSEFLKSLGIVGPLNNKVLIHNLHYKVTEQKLEEIFKIPGKLVKIELNVDNEGKNKGYGTAEYEHPLEAVQAISMCNGQSLYDRIMNVRMVKFSDDCDAIPSKLPSGLNGIGKGLGINGQPMQFNKTASGYAPNGNFGFGMGLVDLTTSKADSSPTSDKESSLVVDLTTSKADASPTIDKESSLNSIVDLTTSKADASPTIDKENSLNSDVEGEASNKLDCAVCLQQCLQPVQLPCSHIFCFLCVKGVTQQSKKCPMCRQDIPLNYLDNPQLISAQQSSVAFEGKYQWFYEGQSGWWQYDDRTSMEIDEAFKKGKSQCEVHIAGINYIIDFQMNVQTRQGDSYRRRHIKRDLVTIPKKGVAGIRVSSYSKEDMLDIKKGM